MRSYLFWWKSSLEYLIEKHFSLRDAALKSQLVKQRSRYCRVIIITQMRALVWSFSKFSSRWPVVLENAWDPGQVRWVNCPYLSLISTSIELERSAKPAKMTACNGGLQGNVVVVQNEDRFSIETLITTWLIERQMCNLHFNLFGSTILPFNPKVNVSTRCVPWIF